MTPQRSTFWIWKTKYLLALCLLLAGCGRLSKTSIPSISFSRVPVADRGDPDQFDSIEGHASGVRSGQRIVLYAEDEDRWWIQPSPDNPFTTLQGDSQWKNRTHRGMQYAALLVDANYNPPETTEILPVQGDGVVALAVVKGKSPSSAQSPHKTLHFGGYDWIVRTAPSYRGGSKNEFDPANAWIDARGALHLRITQQKGKWRCGEVQLSRSLGYGTYVFVVRDTSQLEPSAVLSLFTWDGLGSEENRRELTFEVTRWGDPADRDNADYVVQPYYIPTNVVRFHAPRGVLSHSVHWEPSQATFTTFAGPHLGEGGHPLSQHVFTSGIPPAGGDSVRMNLYVFGKGVSPLQHENEVVIEKFEFYP